MKILSIEENICGEGSYCYLVLPEGVNAQVEAKKWREWYDTEYLPALSRFSPFNERVFFVSFEEWLRALGARDPNEDELEIVEEP